MVSPNMINENAGFFVSDPFGGYTRFTAGSSDS